MLCSSYPETEPACPVLWVNYGSPPKDWNREPWGGAHRHRAPLTPRHHPCRPAHDSRGGRKTTRESRSRRAHSIPFQPMSREIRMIRIVPRTNSSSRGFRQDGSPMHRWKQATFRISDFKPVSHEPCHSPLATADNLALTRSCHPSPSRHQRPKSMHSSHRAPLLPGISKSPVGTIADPRQAVSDWLRCNPHSHRALHSKPCRRHHGASLARIPQVT